MSKRFPTLIPAALVAVAAMVASSQADAGVVYAFRGGVTEAQGICQATACTVDGRMEISAEAFRDRWIDDPNDLTAFSFAVSSEQGGFRLEWPDLAAVCATTSEPCINLGIGPGDALLTSGLLIARHVVATGPFGPTTPSDLFSVVLEDPDGDGAWSGTALSDQPEPSVLTLTGAWIRVPEPGVLSLLLAGLAAIGLFARRRCRAA